METRKWNEAGFSLVELLITMVISAVMFAAIGMIIVYANQAWLKSADLNSMLDDARVAKRTIGIQASGAITLPFAFSLLGVNTGTQPAVVVSIPVGGYSYINYNPGIWSFVTVDHNKKVYKVNEYSYDSANKTINYDWYYATTAYGAPSFTGAGQHNTITLVNNATGMTVTPLNGSMATATEFQVQITQEKQLIGGTANTDIITQFIINDRNK